MSDVHHRQSVKEKEDKVSSPPCSRRILNLPPFFHFNAADRLTLTEWACPPKSLVFNDSGELWIADPPRHRLLRYQSSPHLCRLPDMPAPPVTRLIAHPTRDLVLGLTRHGEQDGFAHFTSSSVNVRWQPASDQRVFDWAMDADLLFVVYLPQFCLHVLSLDDLHTHQSRLVSGLERHIDPAPQGGLAVANHCLFLAANTPPRVLLFQVRVERVFDVVDRVSLVHLRSVGQYVLQTCHSLACDALGNLLVADEKRLRVYNHHGRLLGQLDESECPGETAISSSGVVAFVERGKNQAVVLMKPLHLRFQRPECMERRIRL